MSNDKGELPSTPAYLEQREALDPGLRGHYDSLVQDYRFYAQGTTNTRSSRTRCSQS